VRVVVPSLRDRPDDIAWLLGRFFEEFNEHFRAELAGYSALTEEAALAHAWPGNVRELRNRVERGVALALGPHLMPGDLFPENAGAAVPQRPLPSLEEARVAAERRHILRALGLTGGEIAHPAKLLGISRTTLW
jgi:DNA-binding NtrC family response regulator